MKTRYWVGALLTVIGGVAVAGKGAATDMGAYASCAFIVGIALTIFLGTLRLNGHRAAQSAEAPKVVEPVPPAPPAVTEEPQPPQPSAGS